jgi:hypothetical protein
MDFYEYLTNKGVIPYRLMGGIRSLVDFEHNYNENYEPIRKDHYPQDSEEMHFTRQLFCASRIIEETNSGKLSKENVRISRVDKMALQFIYEVKMIYNENQKLQNEVIKLKNIEREEMKKYGKYYKTTVSLDEKEHQQFIKSGFGIKKIVKTMLDALVPPDTIEETHGDGKNKSGIMRNFEEEV